MTIVIIPPRSEGTRLYQASERIKALSRVPYPTPHVYSGPPSSLVYMVRYSRYQKCNR